MIISIFSTLVNHLASFFADVHPVSRASSTYTLHLAESSATTISVVSALNYKTAVINSNQSLRRHTRSCINGDESTSDM